MAALEDYEIKYLVVGGIAVGFHSAPRYTKDLDVLVFVEPPDHEKLYRCLEEYGAPVSILSPGEFLSSDFVFHFGAPPWRIDILTSIPGVNFREAYADRVDIPLGDFKASGISREWLIKAKIASGRPQDLIDAANLERE